MTSNVLTIRKTIYAKFLFLKIWQLLLLPIPLQLANSSAGLTYGYFYIFLEKIYGFNVTMFLCIYSITIHLRASNLNINV